MIETHWSSMPRAGRRPAIQEEFVSVNSPIRSSVPMPIISAFNFSPRLRGQLRGVPPSSSASTGGSVAMAMIGSMRELSTP